MPAWVGKTSTFACTACTLAAWRACRGEPKPALSLVRGRKGSVLLYNSAVYRFGFLAFPFPEIFMDVLRLFFSAAIGPKAKSIAGAYSCRKLSRAIRVTVLLPVQ